MGYLQNHDNLLFVVDAENYAMITHAKSVMTG
jgi:hypothetical protein